MLCHNGEVRYWTVASPVSSSQRRTIVDEIDALPLNQRVHDSSPCTPTTFKPTAFKDLWYFF